MTDPDSTDRDSSTDPGGVLARAAEARECARVAVTRNNAVRRADEAMRVRIRRAFARLEHTRHRGSGA